LWPIAAYQPSALFFLN